MKKGGPVGWNRRTSTNGMPSEGRSVRSGVVWFQLIMSHSMRDGSGWHRGLMAWIGKGDFDIPLVTIKRVTIPR